MTTQNSPDEDDQTVARPVLRVVSGNPGPAELAALTVVLAALGSASQQADPPPSGSAWADLSLRLRRPLPAGPGAWRNSVWG